MRTNGRLVLAAWILCGVAVEAQQPAAPPPPPPKAFTMTVGGGVSLTGGNSDTLNISGTLDAAYDSSHHNVMKLSALFLRGRTDGTLTVNRNSVIFRDENTVIGRTFLFGQTTYQRDTFQSIDYLVAPTVGMGFKALDSDRAKLNGGAGIGGAWEKDLDVDLKSYGAVSADEKLTFNVTPTTVLKHALAGLWNGSQFADGLYTFSSGVETKLAGRFQLSVDIVDTFKNRPAGPGKKRNDIALVTNVTAKY